MKKLTVILFTAFLAGFMLFNLCKPDTVFSPMENRNLAGKPAFSVQKLLSGAFARDYESYVTDQFALRDDWMALKAACERLLGKRENGGVYICQDTLIERLDEPDRAQIDANLRAINRFADSSDIPVYLTIIPGAQEIWKGKLPYGAPGCDEEALIDYIAAGSGALYFDTLDALRAHADRPLYYRTDHHWTSEGAYWGAHALAGALGVSIAPLDSWAGEVVSSSFYGTLYSKSGARGIASDEIKRYVPDEGVIVTRIEAGEETPGRLYEPDFLSEKDQYAYFLGGNQPLAVIDTPLEGGKKLLLIRDSYADCEVPFLASCCTQIHVMDLRYYKSGIAEYAAQNDIDAIVISYSLRTFIQDGNLYFLNA